jgi:hypothetical protein
VTQAIEHQLCKLKALSSNPSPTKKKKKKKVVLKDEDSQAGGSQL